MQKQRFLTLDNLVEDLIFLRTENWPISELV